MNQRINRVILFFILFLFICAKNELRNCFTHRVLSSVKSVRLII